jgi:CHASE3 domain sensor protein
MKCSIGNKIGGVFCLVLAALVVVGVVSRDSTAKLIDPANWVAHAHRAVTGFDEVPSTLKDAETGSIRSAIGAGWPVPPDNRYGA